MNFLFRHIITFSLLFQVSIIYGQNENGKLYQTLSAGQGLSQGMIFDMIQDAEGFIWIATKNGLNRYDGYRFKVFTNDPYNNNSLSHNNVVRLFEDSKGRIWCGTEDAGLNVYLKNKSTFIRLRHNPRDPGSLSGNGIRSIAELPDGRMLIATDAAGLNIITITADFLEKGISPPLTRVSLPGNEQVYGMGKDKYGKIWIGGMKGSVYLMDTKNYSFSLLPNGKLYNNGFLNQDGSTLITGNFFLDDGSNIIPLFDTARCSPGNIIFKPKKALWEYYHRWLSFYDIEWWGKDRLIHGKQKPPADTSIKINYPFIIDKSGIVWSGSVGYGLLKYNTTRTIFTTLAAGNSIRSILPAGNNEILMVNYAYHWMHLRDTNISTAFTNIPAFAEIDNILITTRNEYWIKTDQFGYCRYNPGTGKIIWHPEINANEGLGKKQPFLEDSKGNIWLPGLNGMITIVEGASGKLDSININKGNTRIVCTAILEDNAGTYWMGTENGFARIRLSSNRYASPEITWFYNDINNKNSLNYNLVSCFMRDPALPEKYLWIATKGGGLNRYDKTTGNFLHLTSKEGLPDDVVYGILTDNAGNIWGSTNKGIFCMTAHKNKDSASWTFRNFTKSLGLQDDEFNTGAFAKLPDGQLAFGGVNGLNIFNPADILRNGFTPNIFITDILVGNKTVQPGDASGVMEDAIEQTKSITLNHLQDILTLEFSSLDFTEPGQNKYRYQLVGIDKDWVESGTRRSATYLHLPAGKYIFKVQGSNSQGVWSNKTAQLLINITPPWWKTWAAYILYALLIGMAIRSYFKFRINKARLQSQLDFEQQEAKRIKELDTVKTKLYANITHEFRTPLTVILGMANQVRNNPDKYLNAGVDMIVRNGENLLKLVNQMLDLAKLEDGKMTLNLINSDIITFLRYLVESFQSLAAGQQKQFHFLADTDELILSFDAEKIRQIITNLFSNALKFTPPQGNIYVSIAEGAPLEGSKTAVIFRIKDTGIGIPENQLPRIFDRFYQLDNSETKTAEGTGIGLALTKELVKLMDGTIVVKSPPVGATKGTEFIITIPLEKVSTKDAEMIHLHEPESKATNGNADAFSHERTKGTVLGQGNTLVLLVEDNADVVAYTASCLPNYKLAVGKDGREGFEIATEIIPDLIITDVMMPFLDGFEMCRMLRQDPRTSHIPIIMLTAKADMQSRLEGLEQGADAYLEKPFHKEELLLRIRKLLELRKSLQDHYSRQIGLHDGYPETEMPSAYLATTEKAEHAFVKNIRSLVENNFTNYDFSVEQLCKLAFMSHSQLHRKLEALTGCSPNKFIRTVRMNKARELLSNPGISISSVARDCGYEDPGYFARVFKQDFGVTPQEWRIKQAQQQV